MVDPAGELVESSAEAATWLKRRAARAIILFFGFYFLAIGIALLLITIAVLDISAEHPAWRLVAFCLIGAGIILWSILPRSQPFMNPGLALDLGAHPRLRALLEDIAGSTGQAMPVDVFLIPDMNAWVSERDVKIGRGGVRIMGLGLPMLQLLSVSEMKAVLLHEFGHYYSGDTRVGPWIYRTRAAMGRTLQNLSNHSGLLQRPFLAYGKLFLEVTHAISREQERLADALAARSAGSAPLISGFMKVNASAALVDVYWRTEVGPVLSAGFSPALAAGLQQFMDCPEVRNVKEQALKQAMESEEENPFDTHPPLKERIQRASLLPAGGPGDPSLAITLLDGWPSLEQGLIAFLMAERAAGLVPIRWDEVAERVMIPNWNQVLSSHQEALAGITMGTLPEAIELGVLARRLKIPEDPEQQKAILWLLAAALGFALHRAGWSAHAPLAEEARMIRGGEEVVPLRIMGQLLSKEITPLEWQRNCARWGISGLALSGDPPAAAEESVSA